MEYKLERSRRKTVSVIVRDGRVTVRAPMRTPLSVIENFVREKSDWIEEKLAVSRRAATALGDVLDGRCAMYRGRKFPICRTDGGRTQVRQGTLYIPDGTPEQLCARRRNFYRREAKAYLGGRLAQIAQAMGVTYAAFALTNAKSLWGSCTADGAIRLHTRLIMLDDALIDYVIVHELCHRRELNHSTEFWTLVGSVIPDWKARRAALKDFSILLRSPY